MTDAGISSTRNSVHSSWVICAVYTVSRQSFNFLNSHVHDFCNISAVKIIGLEDSTVTTSSMTRLEVLTSPPNSDVSPSRFHLRPDVVTVSQRPNIGTRPHVGPSPTITPTESSAWQLCESSGNAIRIWFTTGLARKKKAHVSSLYNANDVSRNVSLLPQASKAFMHAISWSNRPPNPP